MFGHRLLWIRELAQGRDREPVIGDRESKSSSHETTFERDTADPAFLEDVLRGFLRMLARDLRQEGLAAEGCTVKLKDARFAVTTRQRRFSHPLNRLAGLTLISLVPIPAGLYDQRRRKAVQAMDTIIARHGAVIGLGGVCDDDNE